MIGSLRGRITSKTPPQLTVDVAGVGYELEAPDVHLLPASGVGQVELLLTHLVVREDAQLLYGFTTEEERQLFRALLHVTGIGPKIALALLSGMSVDTFMGCVENQVWPRCARAGDRPQDRRAHDRRDEGQTDARGVGAEANRWPWARGRRPTPSVRSSPWVTGRPRPRACSRRPVPVTRHRRTHPAGVAERGQGVSEARDERKRSASQPRAPVARTRMSIAPSARGARRLHRPDAVKTQMEIFVRPPASGTKRSITC